MAVSNKETIYVDVDDEITTIIDKVKSSKSKIIALVLPKRATVMQSVVNMKLLKKAGLVEKKSIVLVTSEKGLLPLAGVAGLYVAKSPQSKPAIPPLPSYPGESETSSDVISDAEPELDRAATIGALAAAATKDGDDETIELDSAAMDMPADTTEESIKKPKKLKHLKVPNFERFRVGIFLAGLGVVLLIIGWYYAAFVLPKAQVVIKTNTTSAVSSFDFTASATVTELDLDNKKIPAIQKTLTRKDELKVPATGQKDIGTKAEGTMTLKNCSTSDDSVVVAAGTRFSSGEFGFVSSEAVTLPASSFSGGGTCTTATRIVDVLSEKPGDAYNLSARTYTVGISGLQASGSDMDGGTSKIVKVVSQKDIDEATNTLKTNQEQQATDALKLQFETDGLYTLTDTRKAGESGVAATPAVDVEAEEVTIAVETAFTMLGIKRDDLSQMIKKDVEGEPSLQGQSVTDDGINDGIIRLNNQVSASEASLSFRTSVTAGPQIDENFVKESIRGKKRGEAEGLIKKIAGVEEATITYSPFWVYTTPKSADKIVVTIESANEQNTNE